jgi:hypothetical protein
VWLTACPVQHWNPLLDNPTSVMGVTEVVPHEGMMDSVVLAKSCKIRREAKTDSVDFEGPGLFWSRGTIAPMNRGVTLGVC